MRTDRVVLIAVTLFALSSQAARAGLLTIDPNQTTIAVGQTDQITINVGALNPQGQPGAVEEINAQSSVSGGSISGTIGNFQIAQGLSGHSFFMSSDPSSGSAEVNLGNNLSSTFSGDVYSFDFTPTTAGSYTFSVGDTSAALYLSGGDPLHGDSVTITVQTQPVNAPEPASLTLMGIGVAAIGLRVWRRRLALK
jgi:hypothetical protein